MTSGIVITICVLLLIAYVFDLTSTRTKIPSVILLLFLGWVVRELSVLMRISIPSLTPFLPVLGTIGLILIVLEGSLELEYHQSKIPIIKKTFLAALFPMIAVAFILALLFNYFGNHNFTISLLNAIPFVVISSSVAIPSVKDQAQQTKELVIYESSFSDILGILFFNFLALNASISILSFVNFGLNLIIISLVSFVASIGLAWLLSKIDHHIKFAPIILLVILIYEIAKEYNLPALLFILMFGLLLGNLDHLRKFRWINNLKPRELNTEVHKFKELIIEGTFLIRSLFFLLFGYVLRTEEILNKTTFIWALVIIAAIFAIRAITLRILKLPLYPALWIAPRGLINILLFLGITSEKSISITNRSLIVQVIILSALIMMAGLITTRKTSEKITNLNNTV